MMFLMDMFLLFAVGSVLGVAVETVYVYLATGGWRAAAAWSTGRLIRCTALARSC